MDVDNANCKINVSKCTDMEILAIERPLKVDIEITGLEKLIEELHRVFAYDHVNVQDVQKLMAGYKSDPKDWKKYAKFDRFRYTRNLVDAGNGAFNIMILCWGGGHASAIHDHADSHCFMKLLSGSLEEIRYDWPENIQPEARKVLKHNKPVRRCCSESEDFDSCQNCDRSSENNGNGYNGKVSCQNGNGENGRGYCHNGNGENGSSSCHNEDEVSCQNGNGENGIVSSQNGNGGSDSEYSGGYCADEMVEIGRTRLELNDVCYINDALGLHRMENPSHVDGAVSLHLYSPPFDSCRVFDARTGKPTRVNVTFTSIYGKKVKRVMEANEIADSQ